MPRWNEFLRFVHLPPSTLFEDGNPLAMRFGGALSNPTMHATQALVFGACRAAAAALEAGAEARRSRVDASAASAGRVGAHVARSVAERTCVAVERPGPRPVDIRNAVDPALAAATPEPLVIVDDAITARAFAALPADPAAKLDVGALVETFLPTAMLYESKPARTETALLGLRDPTRRDSLLGLTAMGEYRGGRRYDALGDVVFLPPVVRGQVRARSAYLRKHPLDPPTWGESGGPFWRLGRYNLWRLDVLGWSERLALAALVGTNRREAVLIGPRRLFPRVGFVIETARLLGRTLIGVPLEAVPKPLRNAVEQSRDRMMSRRAEVFMGLEAFL